MREESLGHENHTADVDIVDTLVICRRDLGKRAGQLESCDVDEDGDVWAECVGGGGDDFVGAGEVVHISIY